VPSSTPHRWSQPRVILVATDLHDLGRLMPFALDEARRNGAQLVLLHVLSSVSAMSTDAAGRPYFDPSGMLETADKALSPWCEYARREGVTCDAVVREGNAAHQIASAARHFEADRVMLGTRSRGKLSKLLLGSVAEQVLRSVYLPVMTVGPEAHLPVDENSQRVVLHATTLRETSRPSAALACQIATVQSARLVLLHVRSPDPEQHDPHPATADVEAAAVELGKLAEETRTGCCTAVEQIVIEGNPGIEILAEADKHRATLIVLAATHRSTLADLTRNRTIYRVLAHAECPVLTLREPLELGEEVVDDTVEAAQP